MSNIAKIHEALLNRREKVCHRSEIIDIIEEYSKKFSKINSKNALKYLSRHNYINRVFLNFYYINSLDEMKRNFCSYEDKELLFIVLNKTNLKWYLGLNSALYILGRTWQTPNVLTIINSRISGKRKVLKMNVRFIKIKEKLIFGTKKTRTKNRIHYSYSNLAKTYLDMAYFRRSNKIKSTEKLKEYIKRFPKWITKLT